MSTTALALDTWTGTADTATTAQRFDKLVTAYGKDLQRYALWLAGDRHIAEDLAQETLIRAWKSLNNLQNQNAAKGWLLTILRRENARRFERYQPRQSRVPTEDLSERQVAFDTSTDAFVLRQALDALADEYREPLLLQVVHGYSQKEIAEHLGITSAGVGTRLFRARQKLRQALGAQR
jgi:RNA polymerase sigma-70 factor (ECF subfamily)